MCIEITKISSLTLGYQQFTSEVLEYVVLCGFQIASALEGSDDGSNEAKEVKMFTQILMSFSCKMARTFDLLIRIFLVR